MNNNDTIEVYHEDVLIATVKSSMVVTIGDLISIKGIGTCKITRVIFAIDHLDDPILCSMRCSIDVKSV